MSDSNPSYHLRQHKIIERQLFIDLLNIIDRYKPINKYHYIGFGGPFLEDFKLLHNTFNLIKMTSLELNEDIYNRQTFNKPNNTIELKNSSSRDYINEFNFDTDTEGTIFWLDYTDPKSLKSQLDEFENVISRMNLNSIFKITINANPACLDSDLTSSLSLGDDTITFYTKLELYHQRHLKIRERLADRYCPASDNDFEHNNSYANYLRILLNRIIDKVNSELPNREVKILSLFKYADGHQMLTCTGIIIQNPCNEFQRLSKYNEWPFIFNGNIIDINMPVLSIKERIHLDSLIPNNDINNISSQFNFKFGKNNNKLISNYIKLYRYNPIISKIII